MDAATTARLRLGIAALAFAIPAFSQTTRPYTLIFDKGKSACQTISFAVPWIAQPISEADRKEAEESGMGIGEEFLFRRQLHEGDDAVLVTISREDGVNSPHKYRVSLDPSIAVQEIDDTEWKSAHPVIAREYAWEKHPGRLEILPTGNPPGWSAGEIVSETSSGTSPGRRWAFVFHWHGRLGPHDKGIPTYRLAPITIAWRNEFAVELADAASERTMVAFHGVFNGVSVANVLDNSGWPTDRMFWMPLDSEKQTILICDAQRFQTEGSPKP